MNRKFPSLHVRFIEISFTVPLREDFTTDETQLLKYLYHIREFKILPQVISHAETLTTNSNFIILKSLQPGIPPVFDIFNFEFYLIK